MCALVRRDEGREWVLRGKGGSVQGRRCGDGNGVRGERDGVKKMLH